MRMNADIVAEALGEEERGFGFAWTKSKKIGFVL